MGWISISEWLRLPYLDIWRMVDSKECTTFGDDVRKVLGSISSRLLIKHHAAECAAPYARWMIDEDNFSTVDLGQGSVDSICSNADLGQGSMDFTDKYHGICQNIMDFIQLFFDVMDREKIKNSAGKECCLNPSPLPADVELFQRITHESRVRLKEVDLTGNCFATLRRIGFWVFNAPPFLVEGERESYSKEIWRLKDKPEFRDIFSHVLYKRAELIDWMATLKQKDKIGALASGSGNAIGKKDVNHKIQGLFQFLCDSYEHPDCMNIAFLEMYLQDMFPAALSSIYEVLYSRYQYEIHLIRCTSKAFSWGGH